MIKEFKDELQAKAIADSLGLIMTKYKGVYIVSNSKEEMLTEYNLGYYSEENIFYDKEVFEVDEDGFLVIKNKDIVDASLVEIPYNLRNCSYMFFGCTSLEIPPIIPKGVKDCSCMFFDCTSLEIPPIIPDSVKNCFSMFAGCTALEIPPIIPEGVKNCFSMFEGVKNCFSMFECCTALKHLQ